MSIEEDLVDTEALETEIQRVLGRGERMWLRGMRSVKSILSKNGGTWRGIEDVRIVEDEIEDVVEGHAKVYLEGLLIGCVFLSLDQLDEDVDTFVIFSSPSGPCDQDEYPSLPQAIDQMITCLVGETK